MKKLILPLIVLVAVAIVAIGQNLNEAIWKPMPERSVTMGDARTTSVSNLWVQVDAQKTNTRLNYLVIRRAGNTFTLHAGEDMVVKLVEVP